MGNGTYTINRRGKVDCTNSSNILVCQPSENDSGNLFTDNISCSRSSIPNVYSCNTPTGQTVNCSWNGQVFSCSLGNITSRYGIPSQPNYSNTLTPTITGFSPAAGPPGSVIIITGTNLSGATAAYISGNKLPIIANTDNTVTIRNTDIPGIITLDFANSNPLTTATPFTVTAPFLAPLSSTQSGSNPSTPPRNPSTPPSSNARQLANLTPSSTTSPWFYIIIFSMIVVILVVIVIVAIAISRKNNEED